MNLSANFQGKGSKAWLMLYSARVICLLAILLAITWLSDYPHALQCSDSRLKAWFMRYSALVICLLAILLAMPNSNRK